MADARHEVWLPRPEGETGHEPSGKAHGSEGDAIEAAKRWLEGEGKARATVLIVKSGTNRVTSVQYRPVAPVLEGVDADGNATVSWPVTWRIVTDTSEQVPTYEADDAGRQVITALEWQGGHIIRDEDENGRRQDVTDADALASPAGEVKLS
jgi:hypothetical protein